MDFLLCRERSRSPRQQSFGEEDSGALTLTDELALVGFTDDVDLSTIFDETGGLTCPDVLCWCGRLVFCHMVGECW